MLPGPLTELFPSLLTFCRNFENHIIFRPLSLISPLSVFHDSGHSALVSTPETLENVQCKIGSFDAKMSAEDRP